MKQNFAFIFFLIILTSICDTISQLSLKSSVNSLEFHVKSLKEVIGFIFKLITKRRLLISLIFSTLSLFIWLFVLGKADLNFAFSLDSMHYVFIALGSMFLLKERIGLVRWLGIVSIMSGIALVSIS